MYLPPRRRLPPVRRALLALVVLAFAGGTVVGSRALQPSSSATPSGQRIAQFNRAGISPTEEPKPAPATISRSSEGMKLLRENVHFYDNSAGRVGPDLKADEGILVDIDTHRILWERNPHTPHPMASTAKVLSSLVALENFPLDQPVTITPDALTQNWDETVMGLKAGQVLSVGDLLTAMLTVSANDAATAMGVDTVGTELYVRTMNQQVTALGLHDSTFTTPVGLDDPGQLASPYDLAAIASVDVEHFPFFRDLVASRVEDLPATPTHPAFHLPNLNELLDMYPAAVGIKGGWTGNAGHCLIGMAVRDGHRLISVLLNAQTLFKTSSRLLDWGFEQEGLAPLLPPPTPTPSPAPNTAPRSAAAIGTGRGAPSLPLPQTRP